MEFKPNIKLYVIIGVIIVVLISVLLGFQSKDQYKGFLKKIDQTPTHQSSPSSPINLPTP